MRNYKLLVIEDDLDVRKTLATYLSDIGYEVLEAGNGQEGVELFYREYPDVVFTDLRMPVMDGYAVIAEISRTNPETPIIVISGVGVVKDAITAMKLGARDYLTKPLVELAELEFAVKRVLNESFLSREIGALKDKLLGSPLRHEEDFRDILTRTPIVLSTLQYLEAIASTPHPVLVTGETGTGKELLAKAVHTVSGRKGPFVAVNVAGLDDQMFSDSLFGHARGAFSGADQKRDGLIAQAAKGTIFLDEIGDLKTESQVKLLRLLQESEYYPLGSDAPRRSEARIVAATHHDLSAMTKEGKFRQDLYYRLFAHQITISPLRERPLDIPLFLDHFLTEAAASMNKKAPAYPPELISYLKAYRFPGNIRELRAMVYDAVARHTQKLLPLDSFLAAMGTDFVNNPAADDSSDIVVMKTGNGERVPTLKEAEDALVAAALRRANGNQGIAARYLGISRNALNKKILRDKQKNQC